MSSSGWYGDLSVNSNSCPGAKPITRPRVSFWIAKSFFAWINCCCRVWSSTLTRRASICGEVPAFTWSAA